MEREIFCLKLNKNAEGLDSPPFPGEIGKKIFEHISKTAWQMWLNQQTMLINEYRLSLMDPKARAFLMKEMENYLFQQDTD